MPSLTLTRPQAIALALLALAAVLVAARLFGGGGATGASTGASVSTSARQLSEPVDVTAEAPSAPPSILVVDVAGAVRRPGLYRLPKGSRIADAIARAGGVTRQAESASVNLAAPLADGEQVLVPSGAPGAPVAATGGTPSPSAPVDLNSATVEQLDALPGVGPTTAQKIVDYRNEHGPYTSVDDLDAIPGIGPARIDQLRGLVIPA
jgi:competence protein ComEA